MKKVLFVLIPLFAIIVIGLRPVDTSMKGDPGIQSISAITFSPDGTLFIGDSKKGEVIAISLEPRDKKEKSEPVNISKLDEKIAGLLGTTIDKIAIQDMAVDPISRNVYFAVHAGGAPIMLVVEGETITNFSLKNVTYSKMELSELVEKDAKDGRGRSLRKWAISDLGYYNGKVMVSGLSNKEFSSTFWLINYPFTKKQDMASLEIYHAAHGQFETHSPIKTFTAAKINGRHQLIASYTCTPLVLFPLDALTEGQHTKGRTVAELGLGNSPLDMIVMEKNGESYLIMANSSRPVMKIKFSDIESFEGSLTDPVEEFSATAGVDYISFPMVNVTQLDKLDESQFIMIQRKSNGDLDVRTAGDRWL